MSEIKRTDRKMARALARGRQATNMTAYSFLAMTGRELSAMPGLDLRVDLIDGGDFVDFMLYNDSTIDAAVQGIYVEELDLARGRLTNGLIHAVAAGVGMGTPDDPVALPGFVRNWRGSLLSAEAIEPTSGLGPGGAFLTMRFDYDQTSFGPVHRAKESGGFRIVLRMYSRSTGTQFWVCTAPRRIAGPTRVASSRERIKIASKSSWQMLREKLTSR